MAALIHMLRPNRSIDDDGSHGGHTAWAGFGALLFCVSPVANLHTGVPNRLTQGSVAMTVVLSMTLMRVSSLHCTRHVSGLGEALLPRWPTRVRLLCTQRVPGLREALLLPPLVLWR